MRSVSRRSRPAWGRLGRLLLVLPGCLLLTRLPAHAADVRSSDLKVKAVTPGTLGLPPFTAPANNLPTAAKCALGQRLFFDRRLSTSGDISCASCHQPEHAFSDGRPVSAGVGGQLGTRNTPSLRSAAYVTSLFWDGRRTTLEAQVSDPLTNPSEHGFSDGAGLFERLRQLPDYPAAFRQAFPEAPVASALSLRHLRQALACFVRSLAAGASAFDRYRYGHEPDALSPAAQRGLALFTGRAQCASCHTLDAHSAPFSDHRFHSVGIGVEIINNHLASLVQNAVALPSARRDARILRESELAALGRFLVTHDPADIGAFRTPSLRNVAQTAPYMHDGSIPTLAQAVEREVYYRSQENGRPLILTPAERTDLVAFLQALDSPPWVPPARAPADF